ncbi:MAG: phage tail protein [Ruminococcus sp.]|nr:phage tail protein [Ruminococcus sp.]
MYAATFEKSGQAVSLTPDEIANDDEISFEISAKTKLTLLIYPQFAAWGFPEKETAVTLFDLGNNSNTIAFYGRVTDVQDSMDTAGRFCRRVTCANEMDFLDDTRTAATFAAGVSAYVVLRDLIRAHNATVGADSARAFAVGQVPTILTTYLKNAVTFDYCTTLDALKKVLVETLGFEIRTRHSGGVNYFDAGTFGITSQTVIKLGDNLQNIRAAYSAADRVVTRLIPLGGTGYDGKRLTIEQAAGNTSGNIYIDNAEMIAKYGIHEGTLIVNELAAQTYSQRAALSQQLYEIGLEEAAALGTPAVQISLTALDLAKIGLDGYTEFALGNTYLTICPKLGIHHDLRVTALKRKLSSPQNTSLTIAAGSRRRAVRVEPLSRQISRYSAYYDDYIGDVDRKQVEMTQKKLDLRLDDLKLRKLTAEEYEELKEAGQTDPDTIYTAVNEDTGEVTQYLGDTHIDTEGGGGDDGIPYPGEMIMVVDAVPDGFVGTAQADYMQVSISWEEGGYTTETVDDHTYIVPQAAATKQRTGAVSPSENYLYFVLETTQSGYTAWTCYCEDANGYYLGTITGICKMQGVDLLSAANRWTTFLNLPAGTEWIYFVMSKAGSDPVRSESLYYME